MVTCLYRLPRLHRANLLKISAVLAAALLTACGSGSPPNTDMQSQPTVTEQPANPLAPLPTDSLLPLAEIPEPAPAVPVEEVSESEDTDMANPDTTDAQPPEPSLPVACSATQDAIMQRALQLINDGRSLARSCGTTSFAAADPLTQDSQLITAARDHSQDMAQHNFFSHTGSDGSSIGQRVTATGYGWRTVGENIAAGQTSVQQAIDGWFASPGHCSNLMNPAFTEVAVSCVEDSGADYTFYWTNVLAAPQ